MKKLLAVFAFSMVCACFSHAQPAQQVKKVLFQGFWWDYKNNNYPNGWANYLTDLAPRLKTMGVDAIWIPPTIKNQDYGEKGVGYAPYDHYDLGDKYQKNDATTRVGTKDDLLRMIAVMHANGIEVVQDIVPNHLIGAGSDNGSGGQDPAAPGAGCTDKWKNFRYTCYETPATTQADTDYFGRKGRFPKNHQNFHPNSAHGCNSDLCPSSGTRDQEICWQGFGPDVCYYDAALGQSSNATTFNPNQATYSPYNNGGAGGVDNGYMRKHTREWLIWYKKQTGFDGVRIDAVKHFTDAASADFLWNLQNNAQWANGRDKMFAVGEWVGGTGALDAWTAAVQNRAGTFDFNLRAFGTNDALVGMVTGEGAYDMGLLPGTQQSARYTDLNGVRIHRTVPFVNNHDTYRPVLDPNGNITGWNTGSQLSTHLDPRRPRLAAAYAVACAVDGNPQVFFEDVLNIANTGKRWTHLPSNTTDLPVNQDIVNIMKAHGALNFKGGNYKVPSNVSSFWNLRTSSNNNDDYLVIERSGKAIIGVTDHWSQDQDAWIDTDFPVGTVLTDYSGGIATSTTVQCPQGGCGSSGPNRVNIQTRAVGWPSFVYSDTYADPGAHYHGYSIWGPAGLDLNAYNNPPMLTVQEWEMENDLGDSHCNSLLQGGRTPTNSPNARVVGKIFVQSGSQVTYRDSLGTPGTGQIVEFYDLSGNLLHSANGSTLVISGSFVNNTTRWIAVKIRNASSTGTGQKSWIRLSYNAPASISTASYPAANQIAIWTSNGNSAVWSDCRNWEDGKVPACNATVLIPHAVKFMPSVPACFIGSLINRATRSVSPKIFLQGSYNGTNLMNDQLRSAGLLPLTSPYNPAESTTSAVLAVTGNNAITDWVRLEWRDKNNPSVVLQSRSALLQRDGDIVNTDGTSPVWFDIMQGADSAFIAIRHRNHFGARTAVKTALESTVFAPDYRYDASALYGLNPVRNVGTVINPVYALYAGDANGDGTINAADRNLQWRPQSTQPYNYTTSTADFNLDGTVNNIDKSTLWRVNNSLKEQL